MKKILLDTNFLLIPCLFKVDIFSEIDRLILEKYTLYVLDKSIDELNKIIAGKERQADKNAAKLALQLLESKKVEVIKTEENVLADEIIVGLKDYIIATQDMILKRRLKKNNVKVITLRSKSRLILV